MADIIASIKNRIQTKIVVQNRVQPVVTVSHSKTDSILSLRYCDYNVNWTEANTKRQQLLVSSKKPMFSKTYSSTSFVPAIIITVSIVNWNCIFSNKKRFSKVAPDKITDYKFTIVYLLYTCCSCRTWMTESYKMILLRLNYLSQ